MRLVKKVCIAVIGLLIVSCENQIMYRSYHHIPRDGWNKSDTLFFSLAVNDSLSNDSTAGLYHLQMLVRNQTSYKYRNLALAVTYNFPDTMVWRTDTVQFDIASENGNWLGEGISGLYENHTTIDVQPLTRPHRFTFKVTSLMNDSILVGLNDIGFIAHKQK